MITNDSYNPIDRIFFDMTRGFNDCLPRWMYRDAIIHQELKQIDLFLEILEPEEKKIVG